MWPDCTVSVSQTLTGCEFQIIIVFDVTLIQLLFNWSYYYCAWRGIKWRLKFNASFDLILLYKIVMRHHCTASVPQTLTASEFQIEYNYAFQVKHILVRRSFKVNRKLCSMHLISRFVRHYCQFYTLSYFDSQFKY